MTDRNEMYKELETLSKIQDERNLIHIDRIKTILTISISITTIIISFKSGESKNNLQLICYISTISLSGIGVLFGLIHLFGYVVLHNRTLTLAHENILSLLEEKKVSMLSKASAPKYHKLSEKICLISLFLSFLFLIIYGISLEF
jgi:hypothetical protein